ncbi:DUF3426 domain-containing protein [Aquipseudomonas alcaligenes]|uniref:Zinc finger/thioredoxin putative domain-containing protein n=1 Tax=Aquipseudomonas alcaligenes TaxID=43263 RepID=A0AA37CDC1_AQUAC|nr:DUF3426 domain-containing protein [Pseudomonas alcaligenes]BCR25867.1 hypothetical protein KAM426_33940 [Pseudomonas alcaligenes]GIZ66415.1 hypothetical protein KAM428_15000 [Pseudomonas alcaligenes]GIZ70748.1 hypothetical protein KAM429_15090 [Pseudomonas alcaligenes]GIZ75102.1 hypothetical protein KAM430_15110 [Pseudomonas alcaligenes]GIZ79429.1 hypothetical protein KAM432_14770 [Pseudomonas alcaligenes]
MTDSFVTQCPHCRTSFRISRAQLGAAHGAVRCGACMRVFNAAQQLLVDQNRVSKPATAPTAARPAAPVAPAPAPRTAPATTAMPAPSAPAQPVTAQPAPTPAPTKPAQPAAAEKKSVDTLWIHDDLDLDSLDLDEELAKLEEQEMQLSREFLAIDSAPKSGAQLLNADEEDSRHDESWAESLIKDEPPRKTATMAPVRPRPEPASEPLRAEPQVRAKPVEEPPAEREEPPLGNLSAADEEDAEEIADGDYRVAAEPTPAQPAKPVRSEPALRDDSLLELSEDPLHLDWQQPKKPWGRWIGWGLLNLIAAGALATQYTVYHFEELARQDQYRPWFEAICPEIGCTLPSKVDIAQIRSTNLVVRSHPQYMDALMVDAILYNRAQFAQPFPLLELRFADLNGQLIASSRFRPSEYLSGELAGQDEMPPQTPIHISLEIKDPGAKAVNYSLSFHSPE